MKKGHFDSKKGGNVLFFQKTESESWGLPLMNGGLKITKSYLQKFLEQHGFAQNDVS